MRIDSRDDIIATIRVEENNRGYGDTGDRIHHREDIPALAQ